MIDDGAFTSSTAACSNLAGSQNPFAAEIVVPLHDDIRPERRGNLAHGPRRSQRSFDDPSGGDIAIQWTPALSGIGPSPGVTSTWTSCPSAPSPSATAVTWTDPPLVPGTVWSMAQYRIFISCSCTCQTSSPAALHDDPTTRRHDANNCCLRGVTTACHRRADAPPPASRAKRLAFGVARRRDDTTARPNDCCLTCGTHGARSVPRSRAAAPPRPAPRAQRPPHFVG